MGGSATAAIGNVSLVMVLNVTLSPASVANAASAEQTFTVPGIHIGDYLEVNNSGANQSGLLIANARATANGTMGLTFANLTAATITPTASTVYTVLVARCDTYADGGTAPSGISA